MKFFVVLPLAIFLLVRCAQRGCTKFLLGAFGVCVVVVVATIPLVRGCARGLEKNPKWEAVVGKEDPLVCFLTLLHMTFNS